MEHLNRSLIDYVKDLGANISNETILQCGRASTLYAQILTKRVKYMQNSSIILQKVPRKMRKSKS